MSDESNSKGALVEKIIFMLLPMIITATIYLLATISQLKLDMAEQQQHDATAREEIRLTRTIKELELDKRISILEHYSCTK